MTSRDPNRGVAAAENTAAAVELVVGGMTCIPCAAQIEEVLNRLDGVIAPEPRPSVVILKTPRPA